MNLIPLETECFLHELFFHKVKSRQGIMDTQEWIENLPNAYIGNPYPLFHSFADGMYTREIHFPAGDLIVGAIHKNDYFVNVTKGKLWVVNEFGSKEITAPCTFVAKAGVKNIGFTLEDTVWIDTHKTEKTDISEAEKDIFADSYEELDEYMNIINFDHVCSDIGFSQEEVRRLSEITEDLIEQPINDPVEIKKSDIEGYGVFASKMIKKGARIALARLDNCRTPTGRYTNHSDSPNAECVIEDNMGFFSALTEIKKGSEITVDYRDVRDKAILLDEVVSCQA